MLLIDAVKQYMLCRPLTLKDIHDGGRMETSGTIYDLVTKERVTLLEAVRRGIVDTQLKCVTNLSTAQLLTLPQAFAERIVLPEGKFRDPQTDDVFSLNEAVNRGLITSVSTKTIFDIDGIKDPDTGDYVSLNVALTKGIVNRTTGEFRDSKSGRSIPLDEAVVQRYIQPQINEMLSRPIGIHDGDHELTVFRSVLRQRLNPQTGQVTDPDTLEPMPLEEAVRRRCITLEGASLLKSMLNITVTTATVTKTIKRYCDGDLRWPPKRLRDWSAEPIPAEDAPGSPAQPGDGYERTTRTTRIVRSSYEDEPETTTKIYKRVARRPRDDVEETTVTTVRKYVMKRTVRRRRTTGPPDAPTVHEDEEEETTTVLEMPEDGWYLDEVIRMNYYDPRRCIFAFPEADRVIPFEECVTLKIIDRKSAKVEDPENKKPLDIEEALDRGVLDHQGRYIVNGKQYTMEEAIERKFVRTEVRRTQVRLVRTVEIIEIVGEPDQVRVYEPEQPGKPRKYYEIDDDEPEAPRRRPRPGERAPRKKKPEPKEDPEPRRVQPMDDEPEFKSVRLTKTSSVPKHPLEREPSPDKKRLRPEDDVRSKIKFFTRRPHEDTPPRQEEDEPVDALEVEMPEDGWYLDEVIRKNYLDPVSGTFIFPGSDRVITFEQCVTLRIIDKTSATLREPTKPHGRPLDLEEALEQGTLDPHGQFVDGTRRIPLKEVIERGIIKIEKTTRTVVHRTRIIEIRRIVDQTDVIRIYKPREPGQPRSYTELVFDAPTEEEPDEPRYHTEFTTQTRRHVTRTPQFTTRYVTSVGEPEEPDEPEQYTTRYYTTRRSDDGSTTQTTRTTTTRRTIRYVDGQPVEEEPDDDDDHPGTSRTARYTTRTVRYVNGLVLRTVASLVSTPGVPVIESLPKTCPLLVFHQIGSLENHSSLVGPGVHPQGGPVIGCPPKTDRQPEFRLIVSRRSISEETIKGKSSTSWASKG
ncbi:Plectin [Amphibalanus amphitrite]|uniref:Plectin n=1 Tax=Amphibalanus amphitrite TaxID=1232801 RepID=A0A6A4VTL9_AMPAM|nr:Plectin [Amphibalanus amphitrite]